MSGTTAPVGFDSRDVGFGGEAAIGNGRMPAWVPYALAAGSLALTLLVLVIAGSFSSVRLVTGTALLSGASTYAVSRVVEGRRQAIDRLVTVVIASAFALAMRTPLHKLADRAIGRLPEGPGDATRASNTWTIVCEATPAQGAKRRGVVSGPDVYGLTAKTTVEGALRLSAPDYERPGALAPSEAFDPADFLGALAEAGVTHSVEERPVEVHS